jgi:hypothetical protein
MAAEKAANAAPPPSMAMGPALRARMAPETKPADRPFQWSFFARYCGENVSKGTGRQTVRFAAQHSSQTHPLNAALDTRVEHADLGKAFTLRPHVAAHLLEHVRGLGAGARELFRRA